MAPVGADGVRWARAKVACARCIREERDCWVASNRRARACEACTRTHVSCSGAVGWGQDEGWSAGTTITIKRKAVGEPEEGTAGKRRRKEGAEESQEDPLQAIARGINSMAAAAWAFVHDQRERESRRASRAVQTVLELSSDEEEVVVKKEKGKEVDKEAEGETEKEKEKDKAAEDEEEEKGEGEDEGEESGVAALALFDHISSDIEQ